MDKKTSIALIKTNPNNPRIIKDDKFKKLVQSIKDFPEMLELRPIVVNKDMVVLGGNMRLKACKEAWLKEIPVTIAEGLTEEQEKEFIVKDNVWFGEWDWNMLANEWDTTQLEDWGLPIDFTQVEEEEAEEDDFDTTPTETPITVLWDLYEIGEHRLLCGDSTNSDTVWKLMNGEKADMVFTDPPFPNNSWIMHDMIIWIDNSFINARIFCDWIMFWVWDNLGFPPFIESVTSKHIWHKTNWFQAWHFETIYVYHWDSKRHEQLVYSVENVWWENNRALQWNHPTPKPVKLITQVLEWIKGRIVLDLFLWSGTTMISSHKTKRKCYGMELDPKYCDVIVNRMRKLDPSIEVKRNWITI